MKPLSSLLRDWREAQQRMNILVERVPSIIGVESVNIVKENFKLQGYDSGAGITKWQPRKESTNKAYSNRKGKYKGSVFNADRKILQQTMNLYNAQAYKVLSRTVVIGADRTIVPYAQIHNEGLRGNAFGKYSFQMPKRQFIPLEGPNLKMLRAFTKKISFERDRALQNFKR